jgi:hypothetical protein
LLIRNDESRRVDRGRRGVDAKMALAVAGLLLALVKATDAIPITLVGLVCWRRPECKPGMACRQSVRQAG